MEMGLRVAPSDRLQVMATSHELVVLSYDFFVSGMLCLNRDRYELMFAFLVYVTLGSVEKLFITIFLKALLNVILESCYGEHS